MSVMLFKSSGLRLLAVAVFIVLQLSFSIAEGGVVSVLETSPHSGQPGAEPFDNDLSVQVSSTDMLQGLVPTLTPSAAVYGSAPITDGGGTSRDYTTDSIGASFLASGQTVIEWTGLASIEVQELLVFGYGKDDRALMEYTIEINTGSGYSLIDTVDNGAGGPIGVSNGTNLVRTYDDSGAPLATGVVGIRITYQDNYTGTNGAAIGEIDVIGTPYVAPDSNGIWTDPSGGNWLDVNNWNLGAVATGSGQTARFDTINLTSNATVVLDSARSLGEIVFGDTTPSHNWRIEIDNPGLPLTLSGPNPAIDVVNGVATLEVAIAGSAGLEKKGNGTLELNRPNTYTGLTKVSAGTLILSPSLKIMPFGDSITYGGSGTNAGYRGYLYTLLNPVFPKFQYIGVSSTNPGPLPFSPLDQRKHNGYASYPTVTLSNNLDGVDTEAFVRWGGASRNPLGGYWLTGGNGTGRGPQYPDMALLLVGANDISWGINNFNPAISAAQYAANLRAFVDKIQMMRPDCHVVIARITPWPARSSYVTGVNTDVDSVCATLISEGRRVSKVDLFTGFPAGGLSTDGLHPSNTGFSWMADKWFEAIRQAVPAMLPENASVHVEAGATFTAENQNLLIDSLTGAGVVNIDGSKLSVGSANSTFIFSGNISGNGSVTKLGGGKATLTGANTYAGDTSIMAGTLEFSAATLNDSASVSVTSGATLSLDHNEVDTIGSLQVDGVPVSNGVYGALDSNAPNKVSFITGAGKLRIGISGYAAWAATNAGGQLEHLDFDGDGTPNGIEFFFGSAGSGFTPQAKFIDGSIEWPRDSNALVSGISVEISSDLSNWTPTNEGVTISDSEVSLTVPPASGPAFYRLRVTP